MIEDIVSVMLNDNNGRECWYRYESVRISSPQIFFSMLSRPSVELVCKGYPVLRHTPCGVWLDLGFGSEKFVLRDAKKRWACPTREEALESFRARKVRQIKILRRQLTNSEEALKLCKHELENSV